MSAFIHPLPDVQLPNSEGIQLCFSVKSADLVSPEEWQEVSELFSASYGYYSEFAPQRAGQRIRLGVSYYVRSYSQSDYCVAFCRDAENLVAHVIYREVQTDRGRVAFVVQLVVAASYRHRGIASTLLHAVWGFSDYYAWGIVTSNAFTVEALESATFRRASSTMIASRADWLRHAVFSAISFLSAATWKVDDSQSRIDSRFYTDRRDASTHVGNVPSRLGSLEEGEEWLAMVFRDQVPDDFSDYQTVIDASSRFVVDAYRRMPQGMQPWAHESSSEVDEILRLLPHLPLTARIADFGAGTGRHLRELRRRGFGDLVGIDATVPSDADPAVQKGDCRYWCASHGFDLILCLYDVIGSYSDDEDNKSILRNIARNLNPGGMAVISVSNFSYLDRTSIVEIDFDNPHDAAQAIFALRPSRTMATNGEFFNSNVLLIDAKRHLVCHKEQFDASSMALPVEYLIRDRRFTSGEITAWAEELGLSVIHKKFVRSGFKTDLTESEGKEILLITSKEVA